MKNQKNPGVLGGVIALAVLAVIAAAILTAIYWKAKPETKQNQPTTSQPAATPPIKPDAKGYITFKGSVISVDLSRMAGDGPGIYIIKADNNTSYKIDRVSGESACDRDAINVSDEVVGGTNVDVRAKAQGQLFVVCEEGTYIKKTQLPSQL